MSQDDKNQRVQLPIPYVISLSVQSHIGTSARKVPLMVLQASLTSSLVRF